MILHRFAAVLAFVQGAYMVADGVHRMSSGAYFGNGLGPWADLVARVGIDPFSVQMAQTFVVFGVLWLGAALLLASGRLRYAVAVLAVATFWYAPIGTAISIAVLVIALTAPGRTRRRFS